MKLNRKLFIFLFIFLCCKSILYSQYIGTWNVLQLKHKFHRDWTINGETQLRSLSVYDQFHYYEFNASIQKQIKKDCNVSLGIGDYNTYSAGGNFHTPQVANEIRLTTQVSLNQNIGKLEVENRYKFEIRRFPTDMRFRIRYRLGLTYPIQKDGKIKINLANELFNSISNHTVANYSIFEKNRISALLQIKPKENLQISIGFLKQYDTRYYDETGKRFFQLITTINI